MRRVLSKGLIVCAVLAAGSLAGDGANAQVRHHGTRFWYSGGYRNPARGRWSNGRYFPNTHNPNRFIHGPGVVVRH